MRRAWVVLVLAVLAGCAGGAGGGGGEGWGDVLVVRVSGGIAGVDDVITVAADGAVTVEGRGGAEERQLGERSWPS